MATQQINTVEEFAAAMLRAGLDKAMKSGDPLGHEAFAAVVAPQVDEGDRLAVEMGMLVCLKNGLFRDVEPSALLDLPKDGMDRAIEAGRDLADKMEKVEASPNPFSVDFDWQEARVLACWLKLIDNRVPAVNRFVAYQNMPKILGRKRGSAPAPVARSDQPPARQGNLTDGEVARREAALAAARAKGQA